MNIERLTEIAEWLEAGAPEKGNVIGFDMSDFAYETMCGTVCCIAGSAIAFDNLRNCTEPHSILDHADEDRAAKILGLDYDLAGSLFYPFKWDGNVGSVTDSQHPGSWCAISPAHAARVIRNLIATGDVDWNLSEASA